MLGWMRQSTLPPLVRTAHPRIFIYKHFFRFYVLPNEWVSASLNLGRRRICLNRGAHFFIIHDIVTLFHIFCFSRSLLLGDVFVQRAFLEGLFIEPRASSCRLFFLQRVRNFWTFEVTYVNFNLTGIIRIAITSLDVFLRCWFNFISFRILFLKLKIWTLLIDCVDLRCLLTNILKDFIFHEIYYFFLALPSLARWLLLSILQNHRMSCTGLICFQGYVECRRVVRKRLHWAKLAVGPRDMRDDVSNEGFAIGHSTKTKLFSL